MNQTMAYRISAQVKRNVYKENKPPNQNTVYEPGQNCPIHISSEKRVSSKFLLGLFLRKSNLHFFQGINPACEILLLLNNMNKEQTSLNYDNVNSLTVT